MEWTESETYAPTKKSQTYSARAGKILISITKDHLYHPGKWVLYCMPFFPGKVLGPSNIPTGKIKVLAVDLIHEHISKILAELEDRPAEPERPRLRPKLKRPSGRLF